MRGFSIPDRGPSKTPPVGYSPTMRSWNSLCVGFVRLGWVSHGACSFGRSSFTHASLLRARTSLLCTLRDVRPRTSFIHAPSLRVHTRTLADQSGPSVLLLPLLLRTVRGDGHIQSPRSSPRIRRSHAARSTVPTSCVLPGTFVLSGGLGKYP